MKEATAAVIYWLDFRMLYGVWWVREMALEWLSVSYRRFERLLWLAYVVPQLLYIVRYGQGWGWTVLDVLLALSMRVRMGDSNERRLAAMFSTGQMVWRLFMVIVGLGLWALYAAGARNGGDLLWLTANTGFVVFQLAVVLADSDATGGRRRKLAMEKVKELFGTSWMPEPGAARTAGVAA